MLKKNKKNVDSYPRCSKSNARYSLPIAQNKKVCHCCVNVMNQVILYNNNNIDITSSVWNIYTSEDPSKSEGVSKGDL